MLILFPIASSCIPAETPPPLPLLGMNRGRVYTSGPALHHRRIPSALPVASDEIPSTITAAVVYDLSVDGCVWRNQEPTTTVVLRLHHHHYSLHHFTSFSSRSSFLSSPFPLSIVITIPPLYGEHTNSYIAATTSSMDDALETHPSSIPQSLISSHFHSFRTLPRLLSFLFVYLPSRSPSCSYSSAPLAPNFCSVPAAAAATPFTVFPFCSFVLYY